MDTSHSSYVPTQEWESIQVPELIGWSEARLQQIQNYAQEIQSFAGLLVVHGRVLAS